MPQGGKTMVAETTDPFKRFKEAQAIFREVYEDKTGRAPFLMTRATKV
jgi:hypothetical protein